MLKVEEAILKTIIYSDIFDFPLSREEVKTYLIGEKISKSFLNQKIENLLKTQKIFEKNGFLFLPARDNLPAIRQNRAEISRIKMKKTRKKLSYLKLNPFLKMVALTGTLAMKNASENDDIDLMLVFKKDRLFLGRLVEFFILKIIGKRRKPKQDQVKDSFCPNLYLTEDHLQIQTKDLYIAHEVIQIKPIWDRGDMYRKFLSENRWVNDFLPNYKIEKFEPTKKRKEKPFFLFNPFEKISQFFQLKYMRNKISQEKISASYLFFHPEDKRSEILKTYQEKVSTILK